ncbi:RNA polymerase sigma factor [Marinirhabdus gelatinilytica]|uniref:RNA polymerase sigma-70 factor (ECF subfamily) n=1 Tax=Marinirhabdus gelatinilytica TaxID=1703343 RepID=A0A370Q765_9FLAO|nr:sigma-70 family RNA polymerase sigma factor [Marinirhabdus gelatinilytica]RDK84196.1 RNA polymerase sigma-70 factor (ECF subfamily) [Marinirhabdus gelatinilytica]
MTQEQLIKGCKKNDRKAQAALFKQYKDTLYFVSLKYSRNAAEAEDNLHDSFMVIFDSIKKFKNLGSFEGWMKRITMFKAIDRYKKNKYVPVETFDETLPAPNLENEVAALPLDTLLQCIQALPDQYRLVFNLYQLDGFSHKEVAGILNISESTSKSNYHRAKKILQQSILALTQPEKNNTHGA